MINDILTPGFYAIVGPLLVAAVLFGRDWFAKSSAQANQDALISTQASLKTTLENIELNAQIAARQSELAAKEAVKTTEEILRAKEAQGVLALTLEKVAQDAAASNVKQAEIGAKVDGHLSALNAKIAKLESLLTASELEVVTEKEKSITALQIEKERGESAAKRALIQHVPETPTPGEQSGGSGAGAGPLQVTIPAVPAVTVPVEDKPLIITP